MSATVLVVGCGSIGTRYARLLQGERLRPFCGRVLVYDLAERAAGAVAELTGATAVGTYEEGLARANAVLICTWPASHLELARAALQADRPVLIEKPLALEIDGWEALAAEAPQPVMVSCNWRFHPGAMRAQRECFAANRLEIEFAVPATSSAERCGGALLDIGSHAVDLASHFLGSVRDIVDVAQRDGRTDLRLAHHKGDSALRMSYAEPAKRRLVYGKRRYELPPTDLMYEYQLQRFLGTTNPPNPLGEAVATLDALLRVREVLACQPSL